jgi:hypothetical protein
MNRYLMLQEQPLLVATEHANIVPEKSHLQVVRGVSTRNNPSYSNLRQKRT